MHPCYLNSVLNSWVWGISTFGNCTLWWLSLCGCEQRESFVLSECSFVLSECSSPTDKLNKLLPQSRPLLQSKLLGQILMLSALHILLDMKERNRHGAIDPSSSEFWNVPWQHPWRPEAFPWHHHWGPGNSPWVSSKNQAASFPTWNALIEFIEEIQINKSYIGHQNQTT